jgi:hypothetical protein
MVPRRAKAIMDRCEVCDWKPPEAKLLHAHHVVAIACGGTDSLENIAVLCPSHRTLAHYVTSRAMGKHYGPSTRGQLFMALHRPAKATADVEGLRAIVNALRPEGTHG